jgi:hypothetical protein
VVGGIMTGTSVSVTGAVTGASVVGGIMTGTSVSVTGAVTGASVVGGIMTGTSVSVTGAVTGASLTVSTGNITGGNLLLSGAIIDSAQLDIQTSAANANIALAPNGTGVVTVSTGISVTGNVQGGNIRTAGLISATGAVTGAALTGTSLTVSTGNVSCGNIVNTNANGVGNIGSSTTYFNTVFAKATSAQYADLAEMYVGDQQYVPGTVLEFGGANEVTISTQTHSTRVAGIVSTNPSYLMNATQTGTNVVAVALVGRVPCQVVGTIAKGDRLVASDISGVAARLDPALYQPACIIGKALEAYESDTVGIIEVAVGRT